MTRRAAHAFACVLAGAWCCAAAAAPGLYQRAVDPAAALLPAPGWHVPGWADPARRAPFDGQHLSCSAQSDSGRVGVAGVYVWRVELAGGIRRRYGARLYVFDLREERLVRLLTLHELGFGSGGRSVEPLACAVTPDAAMVLVVSGGRLALYALANGYLIDEQPLSLSGERVSLQLRGGAQPMVRVLAGASATDFALEQ